VIRYLTPYQNFTYKSRNGAQIGKIMIFGDQLLGLKEDGSGSMIWDLDKKGWPF
jgi:hypothetical protein